MEFSHFSINAIFGDPRCSWVASPAQIPWDQQLLYTKKYSKSGTALQMLEDFLMNWDELMDSFGWFVDDLGWCWMILGSPILKFLNDSHECSWILRKLRCNKQHFSDTVLLEMAHGIAQVAYWFVNRGVKSPESIYIYYIYIYRILMEDYNGGLYRQMMIHVS